MSKLFWEKILWFQTQSNYPIVIYGELDESRMELRKMEVYPNGVVLKVDLDCPENGFTALSDIEWPELVEINDDSSEFFGSAISLDEFEEIWNK